MGAADVAFAARSSTYMRVRWPRRERARHLWLILLIAGAALAPANTLLARGGVRTAIAGPRASLGEMQSGLREAVAVAPDVARVAAIKADRANPLVAPAGAAAELLFGAIATALLRRR